MEETNENFYQVTDLTISHDIGQSIRQFGGGRARGLSDDSIRLSELQQNNNRNESIWGSDFTPPHHRESMGSYHKVVDRGTAGTHVNERRYSDTSDL